MNTMTEATSRFVPESAERPAKGCHIVHAENTNTNDVQPSSAHLVCLYVVIFHWPKAETQQIISHNASPSPGLVIPSTQKILLKRRVR